MPEGGAGTVTVIVDQLRRAVPGGIGTYARGLLLGLQAMGTESPPVTLVAGRGPHPDPLAAMGFPLRASPLPSPVLTRLWDRNVTARAVPDRGVVHATSTNTPYPRRASVVVTVHDVAWREVPSAYPRRGLDWHERALQRCLRDAAVIVVPSPRTAAGLPGERVVVIEEGADHLPSPDTDGAAKLLRSLGVTSPYLLSVSTLEPRKNLPRLVAAFDLARPRLPEPWPLVVVGPTGWGAALQPAPGVKLAGMVSDPVLSGLYAAARCLVYVPLVEGWGLPAVEAMHAGIPVVASPMPSVADGALGADPLDVESIAAAIVTAAADEDRRHDLITAGRARAAELTWEAAARRHVDVWRSLGAA